MYESRSVFEKTKHRLRELKCFAVCGLTMFRCDEFVLSEGLVSGIRELLRVRKIFGPSRSLEVIVWFLSLGNQGRLETFKPVLRESGISFIFSFVLNPVEPVLLACSLRRATPEQRLMIVVQMR